MSALMVGNSSQWVTSRRKWRQSISMGFSQGLYKSVDTAGPVGPPLRAGPPRPRRPHGCWSCPILHTRCPSDASPKAPPAVRPSLPPALAPTDEDHRLAGMVVDRSDAVALFRLGGRLDHHLL